ncbi:MAG: formimidoylglutamate deiminase, partial [Defluviicoccus sp.]|nr:formimidoylglutamate deiminase [Defluviicoccus sp.]
MLAYAFDRVLTPEGWLAPGRIEIGGDGRIAAVGAGEGSERVGGIALPGMPNLHSHAFQRAMAGLTERAGPGADSFWTWRETMYRFVARLDPNDVEAIAAQLYCEMLKAGYTAVAEFHYLHHAPDGSPYGDPAEMAERVTAAARRTGIALTLLPVLYDAGGFGGAPTGGAQRRFANDADRLLGIVETMRQRHGAEPGFRVGLAPHSLRAVGPESLADAVAGLDAMDGDASIHIHIAEQTREVEDCVAWSGRRPVEWLLDAHDVGPRWCLVHATHMTDGETRALAATGAVAGLCPTTEANLGDGLFPLQHYLETGGRLGIGSDSHVSVSPVEELRWLEYGQRLTSRRRNVAASPEGSTGARLHAAALDG